MKQFCSSLIVAFFAASTAMATFAEDVVVVPEPAATQVAEPVTTQVAESTVPTAVMDSLGTAIENSAPALDSLDFASGEVATFDAAAGSLGVKVYLDAAGDANEQTLALSVDGKTEITNGETELKIDSLKIGAEIDVEYDVNTKKATYIFIY